MKFTMFVTQDAMQFNLEPENEHEKEFLKLLEKFSGDVSIKRGADIGMNQAGYVRSFGESLSVVAITIRPKQQKSDEVTQ